MSLKSEALDVDALRGDFPILKRRIHGRRLVYLDNAATTQKPKQVINALVDFYTRHNANINRAIHQLSVEATEMYEGARKNVAAFIGSSSESEIVFTRGTTESINLVRFAWGEKSLRRGDLIVLTEMEHHSNIVPWQLLARKTGAKVRYLGVDSEGMLNMDDFEHAMAESPKLFAFTQCSNVLGTINDAQRLCREARAAGATTLVDGAQSAPHMPVDVKRINCDFFAFSGHKMLGPMGIGALYGRRALLEEMDPFQGGGDMIRTVSQEGSTWNDVPYKFEAGTASVADAVGLGVAIDYLGSIGMEKVRRHDMGLVEYTLETLGETRGVTLYGPRDAEKRGGVVSFNVGGVHPHDMATILDERGIAIRSGQHCAQPLMDSLGVQATNRASFYVYNSYDDVDALVKGLKEGQEIFKV